MKVLRNVARVGKMATILFAACLSLFCVAATAVAPPEDISDPIRGAIGEAPYETSFEHIDPQSAELTLTFTDLVVPGNGGLDIVVQRSYNHTFFALDGTFSFGTNDPPYPGGARLTGDRWELDIPAIYFPLDPSYMAANASKSGCKVNFNLYALAGGLRTLQPFYYAAAAETTFSAISRDNWKAECIAPAEGSTGRVVYSPDGKRYVFAYHPANSEDWFLTKVTDRNGNSLQYNYSAATNGWDAWPILNSITASDGRVVQFSYTYIANRPHLTQITGPSGNVIYSYQTYTPSYQTEPVGYSPNLATQTFTRLTDVQRPDGTHWTFTYQLYQPNFSRLSADNLSTLTTPSGGTITYHFGQSAPDDGWGTPLIQKVTSSALPAATWSFILNTDGTTTYSGPGYCRHSTFSEGTYPSPSGVASYWDYGVPLTNTLYSDSSCSTVLETESLAWTNRQITPNHIGSNCDGPHPTDCSNYDLATYAPVLQSRSVVRDGQTYSTTYSGWDTYGNPGGISESGPNGGSRFKTLGYYNNTSKWLIGAVQSETFTGSSLARTYDTSGNVIAVTQDGVTRSATYDSQGNVATRTDPRGFVSTYTTYKRGIPQSESQPEGISISRVVSDAGNITSETNGEGYTTTFSYDGLNRLTGTVYPSGSPRSITYSATSKTVARGTLVETTQWDGLGRPLGITLGGITTTYSYTPTDQLGFASDPGSTSGTHFTYDALGRLTQVTNADGTYSTTSYGAAAKTVTDERGKATTYSYRSYGDPGAHWLMNITAADTSANIALARNTKDLVTSAVQAGVVRNYGYNGNYYLASVSNPETGTTSYGRDAAGNLTSRSIGSSASTTFTYDGQDRLTAVTYPSGTPSVSNAYNRLNKILTSNSSAASRSYGYDANGNLTSESVLVNGISLAAGYTYNGVDQLNAITYPRSGAVVNYSPDVLGRPTQVSGYVTAVSYWPSGQIQQINYGNGTVSYYGQNSRLWPGSFSTQKSGTYYVNSTYGYDGVGNLSSIADSADSEYTRTVTYDSLSRLSSITGPWGTGSLTYDGLGNIASQALGLLSVAYHYDSTNRLSSVSGYASGSLSYDAYGDVTGDSTRTYAYDDAPNLRCVNCGTSTQITYAYDASNQRVSVTTGGATSYEMYDSRGKPLVEFTPSQSNKLVEYIYLGGKRIAQRVTP